MLNCEDLSLIRQLFIKSKKKILRKKYTSIESFREDLTEWKERLHKKEKQIKSLKKEKQQLSINIGQIKQQSDRIQLELRKKRDMKEELLRDTNARF